MARMSFKYKTATVFGGTGFLGTQIIRELASMGVTIKVASRIPERAYFLKPCGVVGQIVPIACDYSDEESVSKAIEGSDYVVNCIGILYEKKKGDFKRVHTDLPGLIAKYCKTHNARRFVHVSALGIERSGAQYAKTKLAGEAAVHKEFDKASILRPSIIFGEDDSFFNMFAGMAEILPALPLIGGGKTRFHPVFVGDVADAAIQCLTANNTGEDSPCGKIYELGGPEILSFKEIFEKMFYYTNRPRPLVPLPWPVAKAQARILSLLPNPLLTPDQVESLKTDNLVGENALTLKDLGINPTDMDIILPHYLVQYRPGGRFSKRESA